ncbi:putative mitochondrial ferredoxin [Ophiocordyceps camponoti-floridani]|uniref:Putative mitochondrial ferredoxin n=1 Tax=Ophiocordyceps camponoti-floridani TaxID=2030778 RepID=A0A8H4Q1A8_9HYPO|nr:putative mitochondrial ferredoxin [Ophiocordyceps camponoti-floridani]
MQRHLAEPRCPLNPVLSLTVSRRFGTSVPRLYVTFIDKESVAHKFAVSEGDNLLDIAQANDLEMEGACGGSCACSTCHVIVADDSYYDKMPEPDDDENDMLDLAFGLTETSRLGCQIKMTKELDGLVVKLPSMTRNLQASDFQ